MNMTERFKKYLEAEFRKISPTKAAMEYRKDTLVKLEELAQDYRIKGMTDDEAISSRYRRKGTPAKRRAFSRYRRSRYSSSYILRSA